MAAIKERGGSKPGSAPAQIEARDLLTDLDEVLNAERIRLADIPGLLRKLAPNWIPYKSITGAQLRDTLTDDYGVRVTNSGNVLRLDPADLRQVLAQRETGE
jgi:S-DNA-T family DNA segregation ATPase FtsK/SpoIIIE